MCLGQCPAVPGQTTDGVPLGSVALLPDPDPQPDSSSAHQLGHWCIICHIVHWFSQYSPCWRIVSLGHLSTWQNRWVVWLLSNVPVQMCIEIFVKQKSLFQLERSCLNFYLQWTLILKCTLMSQLENSAQWPSWPTLRNSVLVPVTHNGIECWDCRDRGTKEKSSPRRKSVSVWLRSVSRPPVCTLRQWCAVLPIVRHDL